MTMTEAAATPIASMSKLTASQQQHIKRGLEVLKIEAQAIQTLESYLDQHFANACDKLLACQGRIVVLGMGKSGLIGKKIAATFASTGAPAIFVHPAEALHGDLGMITKTDVAIAISNSGTTEEIVKLLPKIKRLGIPLISLTGNPKAPIARFSDHPIHIFIEKEACSLGLAPTASTTATLAIGDALAMCLLQARGFTENDFANTHPGGQLGRKFLVKIADVMHQGTQVPRVYPETLIVEAMREMTEKCLGMTTIVEPNNKKQLLGVFTDGDIRRALQSGINIQTTTISEVMTETFKVISENMLASEAISYMEKYKIFMLPVVNSENELVGALNMHDLFNANAI